MVDLEGMEAGTSRSDARTCIRDEVERFADLSRDEGCHHLVEDADGTVLFRGLLTATLPTELGGDIDFQVRTTRFAFPRPVFTGQTIRCAHTVEALEERDDRDDLTASFECTTGEGHVHLQGEREDVVVKDD
ncbi:MAG: dehydratase [Halobacteriales archaeon]